SASKTPSARLARLTPRNLVMDDEHAFFAQILPAGRQRIATAFLLLKVHRYVVRADIAPVGDGEYPACARCERFGIEFITALEIIHPGLRPDKALQGSLGLVRQSHVEISGRLGRVAGGDHRGDRLGGALHVVTLRVPIYDN